MQLLLVSLGNGGQAHAPQWHSCVVFDIAILSGYRGVSLALRRTGRLGNGLQHLREYLSDVERLVVAQGCQIWQYCWKLPA